MVSYVLKQDTRAALYRPHLDGNRLLLLFLSVAELQHWALRRNWGPRKQADLATHLLHYAVRQSDLDLCREWAAVVRDADSASFGIDTADARIAATARYHGIPLVTHNRRHFEGIPGLVVISEAPA